MEVGVDDYLVKLFVLVELVVWVKVLLCCCGFIVMLFLEIIMVGLLEVDIFGWWVWVNGVDVDLIKCEFDLFVVLVEYKIVVFF